MIDAGKLDRRILIQRPTLSRDPPLYEAIPSWSNLVESGDGEVWAERRYPAAREILKAREIGAEVDTVFVIRFSNDVRLVDPTMRILLDGKTYQITGVRELGRFEGIEIFAVARGEGGLPEFDYPDPGGIFTLEAEAGQYTFTGRAALLVRTYAAFDAALGSYVFTGESAGLAVSRLLAAAGGQIAFTGQSAGLRAARKLAAGQGGLAMTGQAAGLRTSRRIFAAVGTVAFTGQDAALRRGRTMAAAQGSFAYTGQAAGIRTGRRLVAAQGSLAYTGQAATLTPNQFLLSGLDNLYAAHGTSLLVPGYSGALVRLRRSSDNVESDFSPVSGLANARLDAAAITSWLAGATAYVTTLYDQTGNSRHAVQVTAGNQPTLDLSLSFPVVRFTIAGSSHMTVSSALGFARNVAEASIIFVGKMDDATTGHSMIRVANNDANNYRIGLRATQTSGRWESLSRTQDGASDSFVSETTGGVSWGVCVVRCDYANGDTFLRRDAATAQDLSMNSPGNTSNTDSASAPIYGAWKPGSSYSNMRMSAAVLVRDLITSGEAATIVASGAALKAV